MNSVDVKILFSRKCLTFSFREMIGRIIADFQELGISPLVKLRLKIEAIGLAITLAAAFRKKG